MRIFTSINDAKTAAALELDVDPASFELVKNGTPIKGMGANLLADPDLPLKIRNEIMARSHNQTSFRLGSAFIVISPFESGFDCWIMNKDGDFALWI